MFVQMSEKHHVTSKVSLRNLRTLQVTLDELTSAARRDLDFQSRLRVMDIDENLDCGSIDSFSLIFGTVG